MLNTKPNRLVVFDRDATLVDSPHHIADCMAATFGGQGLPPAAVGQLIGSDA